MTYFASNRKRRCQFLLFIAGRWTECNHVRYIFYKRVCYIPGLFQKIANSKNFWFCIRLVLVLVPTHLSHYCEFPVHWWRWTKGRHCTKAPFIGVSRAARCCHLPAELFNYRRERIDEMFPICCRFAMYSFEKPKQNKKKTDVFGCQSRIAYAH